MFHVITPLKRLWNIRALVDNLTEQEIEWHILMDWDMGFRIDFPQKWIKTYYIQNPKEKFYERCNYIINKWLDDHMLYTEDHYCILNDDDTYEEKFFEKLRPCVSSDVIVTSMKRGYQTPADVVAERAHGTDTLIADPDNMKPGYVGVEQIFIKGKIMKGVRLPLTIAGDGEMVQWVCANHKVHYLPEAFIYFNYLEPGRWKPISLTNS